jgi:hypothetical protein
MFVNTFPKKAGAAELVFENCAKKIGFQKEQNQARGLQA